MSNVKQTRVYVHNGHLLGREDFIEQVLKDLYLNTNRNDMREQLDYLLNDSTLGELLCIRDNKYMSYTDNYVEEKRPLKSYEVSYDVGIKPLISVISTKLNYKRVIEIIAATSFKEAKEKVRTRNNSEGKKTKSYKVVEVGILDGVSVG